MRIGKSIGAKIAMIFAASLAAVVVTAAAVNAAHVRSLKEQMLADSRKLIDDTAERLNQDLARVLKQSADAEGGPEGMAKSGKLRDEVRLFLDRNESALFVAVVEENKNGGLVLKEYRDEAAKRQIGGTSASAPTNDLPAMREAIEGKGGRIPLHMSLTPEAQPGFPRLGLVVDESQTYKRIETKGAEITRRVTVMTAILSIALIAAFFTAWALFRGQERLVVENERLDRMAYTGTLASGLAHEIRNPLNAMSVNLGVIREDLEDPRPESPERVREIITHLRAEVTQLNDVVSNFLAFAFPRSAVREPLQVADAVRATLKSLEREFDERRIKVALELDERVLIQGDPVGLRQAFHNLALNAAQAMTGPLRRLRVRCWSEKGKARVAFEDTGGGIAPAELERVFDVFQTTKARGSGFGLPIAQRIVHDHDGRIWAEPAPEHGSVFHLEFPLLSQERQS